MRILGLKKIHQAQKQEMNRCEALFSWAMPIISWEVTG